MHVHRILRYAFGALIGTICLLALANGPPPVRAQSQSATAIGCQSSAIYGASTNGSTQLVTATANIQRSTYICGYTLWAAGTVSVKFIYGTGTVCATGATDITPAFALITQTGIMDGSSYYRGLFVPPGKNVCINTSTGTAVQALLYYVQR